MKLRHLNLHLCGLGLLFTLTTQAATPSPENFKNPPATYRPHTLWFWNNTPVTREGIDEQIIGLHDDSGYGGIGILPFGTEFTPKYLSDEYFDLYVYAVRKAAEQGLKVTLYDEYGFPSGSAGAINGDNTPRFMERYPDLTIKRLDKIEREVSNGETYCESLPKEGKLMGVVAMNIDTKERIDLSAKISGDTLRWTAPQGSWKVMQFVCVTDGDPNMDYLNPAAAQAFIDMIHEAYYKRMPDAFGPVITHTFYDEVTIYRAQGRVWTPRFNEIYEERYGSNPILFYPALWYDIGPETQAARNALFTLRSDLYAEAYPQAITRWSREHKTIATGHQDNEEIVNPVGTSGDLMKCFRYLEMPGIDKIGTTRPTITRPAEKFYKIVASAAYNWDHSLVMAETYGLMGDLSMDSLRSVAIDQFIKGVNWFIPHAAWYNDKKVTFKPELSARNPHYADSLYDFTTFLARLQYMLQNDARFVTDVAVLYPIHTMQGDHYFDGPIRPYEGGVKIPYLDYVQVGEILSNEICRDYQWLHPEVLAANCTVDKTGLKLNNKIQYNTFQTLIIPASKTISTKTLEQALALFQNGGKVIFTSLLPTQSTEIGQDARIAELMAALLPQGTNRNTNNAGGEVLFVSHPDAASLTEALQSETPTDITFEPGKPLRYIHKERDGKALYYLANFSPAPYNAPITLRGKLRLEAWNPHTGERTPIKTTYQRQGNMTTTHFDLALQGRESIFIVEQ